jgi:pimeloyl-ACP methyl ester carboxylesterase
MWQNWWGLWEWFLAGLIERVPVVMMAGPYHFERTPPGEYSGESVCNPNPYRLFEAIRQWCWDQHALQETLRERFDLEPVGVIGYSIGAFNTLLATSSGIVELPVVSIASTNRYAYGVFHGVIGHGIKEGMLQVGIDEARLERMTETLKLDRWVRGLADHSVLYIDGIHDRVDPPPSLDRLKQALNPSRAVHLPAGHATVVLHRREVTAEIVRFLSLPARTGVDY